MKGPRYRILGPEKTNTEYGVQTVALYSVIRIPRQQVQMLTKKYRSIG